MDVGGIGVGEGLLLEEQFRRGTYELSDIGVALALYPANQHASVKQAEFRDEVANLSCKDALGIGYQIVPGVPAFAAAAAALGRELTVPGVAQTITLTRVATLSSAMPPGEDLQTLARSGGTLVIHLAAAQIDTVVADLTAGGYSGQTPTAVVAFASWPEQIVLRGTLSDIAAQMRSVNVTRTAVIVVGEVLAAEGFVDSYLYSADRRRGARH